MHMFSSAIAILWIGFIIYWFAAARGVKRDRYREANRYGTLLWFGLLAVILSAIWPSLAKPFLPQTLIVGVFAIFITALGMAFAIWARVHLGRNWSSRPAVKEGHELVTSGPYRIVRHPIYTGIAVAFLGAALVDGFLWDVFFIALVIIFVARIRSEENLMTNQFPDEYPAYRRHTKALIPFVW